MQPTKVETQDVWNSLISDGNLELIERLRHVEIKTPGFSTIVVPQQGFSPQDETHNKVLDWLHQRDVNVVNPPLMILRMFKALFVQNS